MTVHSQETAPVDSQETSRVNTTNNACIDRNSGLWVRVEGLQGYLAHKKLPTPRTLQWDHAYGHMVTLGGGGAVSDERGTPVGLRV